MRLWEFLVTVILAAVSLIVVIAVIVSAQDNRQLQREVFAQQQIIQQGAALQQSVQPVLVDMARTGVEDSRMRELLAGHGFRINQAPAPDAAAAKK